MELFLRNVCFIVFFFLCSYSSLTNVVPFTTSPIACISTSRTNWRLQK